GLLTSTETFDRQIAWLRANYRIATLDEALEILDGRRTCERDVCVLTFDDGYRDFAEHAVPILRRHGAPALVYVTSGVPESGLPLLRDRPFHLLRQAQRRRIDARGAGEERRLASAATGRPPSSTCRLACRRADFRSFTIASSISCGRRSDGGSTHGRRGRRRASPRRCAARSPRPIPSWPWNGSSRPSRGRSVSR